MKRLNHLWLAVVAAVFPWTSLLAAEDGSGSSNYLVPIGAGLGMAIAAVGGAMGQCKIAVAFLEGVARNPGAQKLMFVPFVLGLALVETLVLFTFVIQFLIIG